MLSVAFAVRVVARPSCVTAMFGGRFAFAHGPVVAVGGCQVYGIVLNKTRGAGVTSSTTSSRRPCRRRSRRAGRVWGFLRPRLAHKRPAYGTRGRAQEDRVALALQGACLRATRPALGLRMRPGASPRPSRKCLRLTAAARTTSAAAW